MQDISPEEEEYNFYRMLEKLEKQPKYMRASLEDYLMNPTDDGAKILWLKYTKLGEVIPEVVMDRMIDVIEHEALGFSSKLYSQTIPEPVFELIHIAISKKDEDLEYFWSLLHDPDSLSLVASCCFDKKLLESARKAFPLREKLKAKSLYKFAADYLNIDEEQNKSTVEEVARKRYETFVKNKEKQLRL